MKKYLLTACCILFITCNLFAQTFKLANVLQSNMVIQQAKPFRLWGTAPAGTTVNVTTNWGSSAAAQAGANGKWIAEINVPAAKTGDFTAYTISVKNNTSTLNLNNLLIGEVWFCAGQSNMDMPVDNQSFIGYPGVVNYEQEIAAANFPNLRYYEAEASFKIQPSDDTKGTWRACTPQNVKNFSAVAYFFGRALHLKLNIPVGLVVSAAAGASCQAFMPQPVLEANTFMREQYLDPNRGLLNSQQEVDGLEFFGKVTKPVLIYNGMIHPLINLSVKGFNWYQGESNINDGSNYVLLWTSMVKAWRDLFKQGDLPFYFVEIAPYAKGPIDAALTGTAIFRETQEDLLKLPNTGMAVTMDVGDLDAIHYSNKRPVGERLTRIALNKTYGQTDIPYLGPTFQNYTISGDTVKVNFTPESAGTGLTTNDGQAPRHFFVAGADKVFYPAQVAIVGNQVWAGSNKVKKPVALRYAFANGVITNLYNKEGLPAVPFRTDRFGYTECSFAYGHYAGITPNCNNCKITYGNGAGDTDTLSSSTAVITTVAGAYIDQHLKFQHTGVPGDVIKLGIKTNTPLNNAALLNKLELFLFKNDTVTANAFLSNVAVKIASIGNNRYNISFTSPVQYDRILLRFHSGGPGLTTLNYYFAVQEFAAPSFKPLTSVCVNSSTQVIIDGNGTYNWYEFATGGQPVFTGNNFTTPVLTGNKTYYVQDTRNTCETFNRTPVTIWVNPAPALPQVIINDGSKLDSGERAVLKIAAPQPGHTYNWYTSAKAINPVFTGTLLQTPPIMADTAIYVEALADGCISERVRTPINISPSADSVKIDIFPNPTQGELNFLFNTNYSKPVSANVYNMMGNVLYTETATVSSHLQRYRIWIGQLPDGIYILNLKGEGFEKSVKIAVSR